MAKAIRRVALLLTFSLLILTSTVGVANSQAGNWKYDADHNGLIEVSNLEQLDAIRYDLDGDGSPDSDGDANKYGDAFPTSGTEKVCESACNGYELDGSLDFKNSGSYASGAVNTAWTTGSGWTPIGDSRDRVLDRFGAEFDGNGRSISNLYINRPATNTIGLFASTNEEGLIRGIGLTNVRITGNNFVGGLVGRNRGTVIGSFASGNVSGDAVVGGLVGNSRFSSVTGEGTSRIRDSYATVTVSADQSSAGGLVGSNGGTIIASYATGNVTGTTQVGGLTGTSSSPNTGKIIASYATGDVTGDSQVGGLVGRNGGRTGTGFIGAINASYATGSVSSDGSIGGLVGLNVRESTITGSYWDTQTSGQTAGVGSGDPTGSQGRTTAQLQSPIGYTGIYSTWDGDLDNSDGDDNPATGVDDLWDFGTGSQYPALKADLDGDGTPTWQEFGSQRGNVPAPTPPEAPPGLTAMAQGPTQIDLSWSAPSDDGGAPITAYHLRHIESGAAEKSDTNWTVKEDVWTTGSGSLQYTLTGLTGGTQYDVQVRAVNAAGASAWSATVTGTTTSAVVPGAPTGLTAAVAAGKAQVVLSWIAPTDTGGAPITGYKIEASDDGNNPWTEVYTTTGDATGYTDEGADSNGPMFEVGTTRHYRVSAINSVGTGPPSNVAVTEGLVARYDTNNDGTIEKNEVIAAINDYLFGEGDQAISNAEVIKLINLYLFG